MSDSIADDLINNELFDEVFGRIKRSYSHPDFIILPKLLNPLKEINYNLTSNRIFLQYISAIGLADLFYIMISHYYTASIVATFKLGYEEMLKRFIKTKEESIKSLMQNMLSVADNEIRINRMIMNDIIWARRKQMSIYYSNEK
ncbi:hypothetical protein HNQ56_003797 [Anaerotaenia torta]|uniref:hypothetical protein n=1 Tax=Anaerotaenia torta TaxID=433293 RepID=UPI003D1CD227